MKGQRDFTGHPSHSPSPPHLYGLLVNGWTDGQCGKLLESQPRELGGEAHCGCFHAWGLGWADHDKVFLEGWLPTQHQVCLVPGKVPTHKSLAREVPCALGLVPFELVPWNLGTGESASGLGWDPVLGWVKLLESTCQRSDGAPKDNQASVQLVGSPS